MEKPMDSKQRLEEALKNANASHAKLMREHPEFVATPPKTLEELIGKGPAARLRGEGKIKKLSDGNIDK